MAKFTDDQLADARLHAGHASVLVTICTYPPEGDRDWAYSGACSVVHDLPPEVLQEIASQIVDYAKDLEQEAERQITARSN